MKKIILLTIAFLMANILFAGPFGLEMGMTLEEIKRKCDYNVKHAGDDMYMIKPPRPSIVFNLYSVHVDDIFGLYSIMAISENMPHKQSLLVLKNVAGMIEAYYGEPQDMKRLKDHNPVYMTSESPDTIICYDWTLPECKKLEKEKVNWIRVIAHELNQDEGAVAIQYRFDNAEKIIENRPPF